MGKYCVSRNFLRTLWRLYSHHGKKKERGHDQISSNIVWLAPAPETQGNLCFSQWISDLVRLSNCLRRGWLAWWAEHGNQRQGTWFLNPISTSLQPSPGARRLTTLFLLGKPEIKTFTCPSGGLWGPDWQMTGLPFMFSMSHIKAARLVGVLFCLVACRATFNDALENQFRL